MALTKILVGQFRVQITSRKPTEELLIESMSKNFLEGCIRPFSVSRSFVLLLRLIDLLRAVPLQDLLAEILEKFWKNVVLRKILRTFVFGKHIVDLPPPSPIFSGKKFCFPEKLGGPGMEGGPNFGLHPPQSETGWHGPGYTH